MTKASSIYRDSWLWNIGLSAYWFAGQWKWFLLLLFVLPGQVAEIVPGGEKNQAWGTIFAIGGAWAAVGPSLFGWISDRLGRRKPFISMGCALTVLAIVFLSRADSLLLLGASYLLLQFSDDVGQGAYSSLIPQIVPEERRGRSSAIMSALNLSAYIFSAVAAIAFADKGWLGLNQAETIYAMTAVVNIVMAAWVLITIRDLKEPLPKAALGKREGSTMAIWLTPWLDSDFRCLWLTRLLISCGFYLIVPFLRFFLEDMVPHTVVGDDAVFSLFGLEVVGLLPAAMAVALTMALCGAGSSIYAAAKAGKIGRKKKIRVAGVIMAASLLPFTVLWDFQGIVLLAGGFGLGYGLYLSAEWALASDVMPDKGHLGQDMGMWQSSIVIGQMLSGLGGAMITYFNTKVFGLGYSINFLIAGVLVLGGSLLVIKIKGSH